MASMVLNTFNALGFPFEILPGGDRTLSDSNDLVATMTQPAQADQETSSPLNLCWLFGYRIKAKEYWSRLISARCEAERQFLTLDFLFPFVYGGALAISLWWVWVTVGRPFHPVWIIAPLAMMLTADWTDNFIQVAQLHHDATSNESRIQNLWIQAISCATIIKLWLTSGLYVSLVGLAVRMILTFSDRRLATNVAE